MPRFNSLRKLMGMPEMTDEREAEIENLKANPDLLREEYSKNQDALAKEMRMKHLGMEGPSAYQKNSPAEEAMAQESIGGAMGTIGSIGNINRGRGLASAFKNKAAEAKNLENLRNLSGGPVMGGRAGRLQAQELAKKASGVVDETTKITPETLQFRPKNLKAETLKGLENTFDEAIKLGKSKEELDVMRNAIQRYRQQLSNRGIKPIE